MGLVVPGIGSQMLRKSKVSTALEGDKILDPEVRHELHSKMKHSLRNTARISSRINSKRLVNDSYNAASNSKSITSF